MEPIMAVKMHWKEQKNSKMMTEKPNDSKTKKLGLHVRKTAANIHLVLKRCVRSSVG